MGTHLHTKTVVGRYEDAKEAFKDAVENALYEHGHDSYNGTISTTWLREVITAKTMPRAGTAKWHKEIDKLLEKQEKGYTTAVEIGKGKYFNTLKEKYGYKGKRNIRAFKFIIAAAE